MKMLRFDPDKRITVNEAIKHPYFKQFAQLEPPESENIFDWSWDSIDVDRNMLQRLIYYESCKFHPEEEEEKNETQEQKHETLKPMPEPRIENNEEGSIQKPSNEQLEDNFDRNEKV